MLSEFKRRGFSSRFGKKRADLSHQWIDPLIVGAPWVAAASAVLTAVRFLARRRQRN